MIKRESAISSHRHNSLLPRAIVCSIANPFLILIALGFAIAWMFGGFPSILLPSFIMAPLMIPIVLFWMSSKSGQKDNQKSANLLHVTCMGLALCVGLAWITEGLLSLVDSGSVVDRLLRKVEFPFSLATHVVADSEGSVYVVSEFDHRIQKYGPDGRFQFGWFAGGGKNLKLAIDKNDHIYAYGDWFAFRRFDTEGNLVKEINGAGPDTGWWRLKGGLIVWDPNASNPEPPRVYNKALNDGQLLPSSSFMQERGFEDANGKHYKLTRLWFLLPVIHVTDPLTQSDDYVMPNPLSLAFTFIFPGFAIYALALWGTWKFDGRTKKGTPSIPESAEI